MYACKLYNNSLQSPVISRTDIAVALSRECGVAAARAYLCTCHQCHLSLQASSAAIASRIDVRRGAPPHYDLASVQTEQDTTPQAQVYNYTSTLYHARP